MFTKIVVIALFCCAVQGQSPVRYKFAVTWGTNPFKSFQTLPRTVEEAQDAGFQRLPTLADCTSRYVSASGDKSLVLIFDNNGIIAGAQMNSKKTDLSRTENNYQFNQQPMFTTQVFDGVEYYSTTAWFVDPATICDTGRSEESLETEGTISGLYFQNGPTPADNIPIDLVRSEAIKKGWSENKCFVGMGRHNFYETLKMEDDQCATFRPAFLLFNKEFELIGFGLAAVGKAESIDERFEYPGSGAIKVIIGEDKLSPCLPALGDSPGLTTMHFYFTSATNLSCLNWPEA